jgi:hypothetical protein
VISITSTTADLVSNPQPTLWTTTTPEAIFKNLKTLLAILSKRFSETFL